MQIITAYYSEFNQWNAAFLDTRDTMKFSLLAFKM